MATNEIKQVTTRTRYRTKNRLFRKPILVLQIAIETKLGEYIGQDGDTLAPPHWNSDEIRLRWRDAKIEDFNLNSEIGKLNV